MGYPTEDEIAESKEKQEAKLREQLSKFKNR
jgi:hypothetical protein